MDKILEWWKKVVNGANEHGIPLPMARVNGKASVTGTMVIVSFAMCVIPTLLMIGTVLAKLGGLFDLNAENQSQLMNAFSSAIQLYIASLGAYLGRGMQRGADGKVALDKTNEPESK